jgi:hypothetical protein
MKLFLFNHFLLSGKVILLVDEDNTNAIKFYDRRGYQAVFSDPASRRYETSGLFVRNVRSTKICMRKKLRRMPESEPKEKVEYNFNLIRFLSQAVSGVASAIQ